MAGSRSALLSEISGVLICDRSKAGLASALAAGAVSFLPQAASEAAMAMVRPSGTRLRTFMRLSCG